MTGTASVPFAEIVAALPLFRGFTPEELEQAASCFVEQSYRKGDVVCRAGDKGDTFSVVVSGELEVWAGESQGHIINRLEHGDFFGELALLTGEPRTATIVASRGTRVLTLYREDFDRLVLQNAKALAYFAQVLCKRLATIARGDTVRRRSTTILVTARPTLKGRTVLASALTGLLAALTRRSVLLVRLERARSARMRKKPALQLDETERLHDDEMRRHCTEHPSGATTLTLQVNGSEDEGRAAGHLMTLIEHAEHQFPIVVIEAGPEVGQATVAARQMADDVVEIVERWDGTAADVPADGGYFPVVNLHNSISAPLPINHCLPFVLPEDVDFTSVPRGHEATYVLEHPGAPVAPPLKRLARKILGVSVGIALGGGAAFGVAHIGVFQALEEHDIPIDLVAGCSMGSIVAIGYAAGIRSPEMLEIARKIGTKRMTLSALDFTLTRPGLLAGNRLIQIFAPLAGPIQDFKQLKIPCRVVATDIETGECVPLASGRLDAAFRASCSVPMLWAPVRHEGRVLVDGGVVDPLPVATLREMGADICIAVNVVPPPRKGVQTILSRASRLLKRFDPLSYLTDSRHLPTMIDVVMNSLQTLQYELGNFKALTADVLIKPDLSSFTWVEFYRAQELIARGTEETTRAVGDIKRVLAERLAARLPPA